MATLETLLSQQMIERLGWTLIHFIWQAATVALLLAVVLRGLRRSSSNVRYVVACLAMALIVALPLVTMSLVEVSRPVAEAGPILNPPLVMRTTPVEVVELPLEPFDAPVAEMHERVTRMPWMQRIATALEPALPWLVLGWLLGVFGLSAWHLGGWAQLQRMKRRLVSEVAAPLHARAAALAGRLGIRRAIGLWASPLIDVPAVVGWIKPVILLPVGAVTGLSVEQLEAILAHELAHVRRCDYLVNLAQTVVEILGFYHPAVWWVSHRIRDERENCCDDLAVQVCGDSRRYARALTSLEELRHVARASRPRVQKEGPRARCPRHTAVAASGGSLVGRIARLLGRPPIDNRRFAWLPGLIALLVVAAILIPTALLIAAPTVPQPLNTEADSAEAARDDNVTPTRFVHWDVEGQIDREFGFERLIREEGDHWIVAIPHSTQSVGKMRCHIRADRGELRLDGVLNQPTPDVGTFRGNVVIEITSSEPNSIDACTLYLDEVTFSAQNKRFTSSGPVRLICGATELVGRGLELSFDEPQDRSDPNRRTIIDGVGAQIAPSGSLIVSLGDPETESSEESASTQPTPVRVLTKTADSRALSLEEKPRVMLDIEPSADAADRQVLLSFTIAEIVTEEALDRATARQLRALLTDASHDAKFNLPSVEELQKPVQYIVSKYANICNQIDDAARAFTDLLVSRGYATVCASPEMLIRLGASGHLSCGNIPVMGPPAPPSQTNNPALSLDVTPTAPHDANGIRLTLALRARNLASLDSEGRLSTTAAYASFNFALSARNNQCIMLPLTTAASPESDDLDAKTATTLLLVKPTLIEPPAKPTPALSASEQATADTAREFVQTDPMVRELARKIAEIEIELLEAQQTFLPEHPEIVQKKQLLEALNALLEKRRKGLEQEFDAGRTSATAPDDPERQRAHAEKALAIMRGQVAWVNERIDKVSSAWYPDEAERSRELADLKRFKEAVEAQLQGIARIVEEQFGPPAEPEPYQLSETERFAERMKHLGLALRLYTENHDGRYPDDLLPLDPYLSLEDSRWIETSVIYLGKGKTGNDVPESPIAYDEMLLKQTGQTHVLFADGQIRVTPEGSSMIWLDHRKARALEASASRQPTPVRVLSETADGRASSPDEKPRVMLDIELVKFLTDRPLSPEAATQLSGLWDQMYAKREARREQRGSLPRVDELQISPQALLERCTENAQGDSEALEILVDLLASREYLKVAMNPTVEVFDGQQAQVMSKQHLPNPTAHPGAPETVECRDLVTVTPRIDGAGHITLDLAAEICDVILDDSKTPRVSKYGIDTKAVVDKNKTFVCRLESAAEGQTQDNGVLYLLARPRVVRSAPSASVAIPTAESEPSGLSTVTATFEGTDLLQVLKTVAEMAGANIMYDANLSGEVYATLDDVPIETALQIILAGSPYVFRKTNYGYEVKMRNAPNVETSSRETDVVEVAARFVLVDRGCMEALRRGLPIQGVTAPADVNALHEIGSGLAEGRTPLLKPDRVELLLRAVGQYAGSKMLAAPKVFVLDGHSASVSLANHIQYTSGYREPNDASPEPIAQHASKEVGVRLDATPHLIEDQNNIRLQFEMEINSLLGMQKALYRGKYEYDVPTFTAVTTATEIVVADGQTALIHVGEAPAVGNILRNESEPAGPLLMLIKPSRTTAEPPDPAPPMQPGRRPGDPGMGALPPGANPR